VVWNRNGRAALLPLVPCLQSWRDPTIRRTNVLFDVRRTVGKTERDTTQSRITIEAANITTAYDSIICKLPIMKAAAMLRRTPLLQEAQDESRSGDVLRDGRSGGS